MAKALLNSRARQRNSIKHASLAGLMSVCAAWPAHAQDAQPTAFSSAFRYDGAGRLVGEVRPDPDGEVGPLKFPATRIKYNALGLRVSIENGELAAWQPSSVAPNDWSAFNVFKTERFAYDTLGRLVQSSIAGSDGVTVTVRRQIAIPIIGEASRTGAAILI